MAGRMPDFRDLLIATPTPLELGPAPDTREPGALGSVGPEVGCQLPVRRTGHGFGSVVTP
jgi:hypothetical protein